MFLKAVSNSKASDRFKRSDAYFLGNITYHPN